VNYYERHLGDYARDAGHLTMLEHGAYTLLLDRHYTTEAGIPADQVYRICRARTRDERAAVDAVLAEFFTLEDGAHVNGRASREALKMRSKVKAAQENGKRGGRPKRTKDEPSENPVGSDWATQVKAHQSPDTKHQIQERVTTSLEAVAQAEADALASTEGIKPTPAGAICRAMKAKRLQGVNPGDPRLLALIEQGATEAEFVGVAEEAVAKGKGWAWVLSVVPARRKEAAEIALAPKVEADAPARKAIDDTQALLLQQASHAVKAMTPEAIAARDAVMSRFKGRAAA
jgi:uncharacterized protein YdaU (DUF1376 family)